MTEQQTIDIDGLTNVAEGIILQAKKDFIKGGKVLFRLYGKIPDEQELLTNPAMFTMRNDRDVRWLYDSWRFVIKDPYDMFSDVNKTKVIEAWKEASVLAAYREWYIPIASMLYRDKESKKDPQDMAKSSVTKKIKKIFKELDLPDANTKCEEFFKAREYVETLDNKTDVLYEWNSVAYERSLKPYRKSTGKGRKSIEQTEYAIAASAKRKKNIEKAKEFKEAGLSPKAIARYLNVSLPCVFAYLRS